MINRFLSVLPTEEAAQIVTNIVVPSFQHIASVESIMEKQPPKNLNLHSAFEAPQPLKSQMGVNIFEVELVEVNRAEFSLPPSIVPDVSIRGGGTCLHSESLKIAHFLKGLGRQWEVKGFMQCRALQEILDKSIFEGGIGERTWVGIFQDSIQPKIFPKEGCRAINHLNSGNPMKSRSVLEDITPPKGANRISGMRNFVDIVVIPD